VELEVEAVHVFEVPPLGPRVGEVNVDLPEAEVLWGCGGVGVGVARWVMRGGLEV
jgi:hypothetical protein